MIKKILIVLLGATLAVTWMGVFMATIKFLVPGV